MAFEVILTSGFKKELKNIAKKHRSILAGVTSLIEKLAENPIQGDDLGKIFIKSVWPLVVHQKRNLVVRE